MQNNYKFVEEVKHPEETCSTAPLYTTDPKLPVPRLKLGCKIGKPASNNMGYDMATLFLSVKQQITGNIPKY
jgi:hypothetical protein